MLTNRFKLVDREEYTNSIKLAEYATPYPKKPEDEKRKFLEKPCDYRNAFIRDRDRILHCVSFRKMLGKTQVFISEKNPKQRNRLTHTMEVWQISVSIAMMLKANIHLTEAIAFGHDLGHTPFGHAGESALNLLMESDDLEGFSHNEQSVRVVSLLESPPNVEFLDGDGAVKYGLNLTSYTREGLFKHTCRFNKDCKNKELIKEFGKDNGSIEAQIVNISDEIAQCTHDLQDVCMANAITKEEIINIFDSFKILLGDRPSRGKQNISTIIGTLINDVSKEGINKLNEKYTGDSGAHEFIIFSKEGNRLRKHIKNLINENAILGDEVNTMNSRGRHILNELYIMFKKDPYCLPKGIKNEFSPVLKKELKNTKGYGKTEISNKEDIRVVCDYIASLTDKEAIDAFHSTFL
ncbi:MAG: dNTP triphosphohydrolase [Methanophagales archaeon]|nr:dNTP triphosphohydrolase [Methanophagales archaeon]